MGSNNRRRCGMAAILCFVMPLQGGLVSQAVVGNDKASPRRQAEPKTTGKPRPAVYAAISPDGRLGASYYGKTKICIWNRRTGTLLQTIKYVHSDDETYRFKGGEDFQFSRTGKWLLIKTVYALNLSSAEPAHDGESLDVWNTTTGRRLPTPMRDMEDTVRCFAFMPDEMTLVYDCIGKFGTSCTLYKVNLITSKSQELRLFSSSDINPQYETRLTSDGRTYTASGFGPYKMVDVTTFKLMEGL